MIVIAGDPIPSPLRIFLDSTKKDIKNGVNLPSQLPNQNLF